MLSCTKTCLHIKLFISSITEWQLLNSYTYCISSTKPFCRLVANISFLIGIETVILVFIGPYLKTYAINVYILFDPIHSSHNFLKVSYDNHM